MLRLPPNNAPQTSLTARALLLALCLHAFLLVLFSGEESDPMPKNGPLSLSLAEPAAGQKRESSPLAPAMDRTVSSPTRAEAPAENTAQPAQIMDSSGEQKPAPAPGKDALNRHAQDKNSQPESLLPKKAMKKSSLPRTAAQPPRRPTAGTVSKVRQNPGPPPSATRPAGPELSTEKQGENTPASGEAPSSHTIASAEEGGITPFGAKEGPAYQYVAQPEYPLRARRSGIQGTVRLLVALDAQGGVTRIQTQGEAHPLLEQAAITSVRRSTFRPLTKEGRPTPCRTVIPIRFELR